MYDVLSYIAYATPVSTREERALMAADMLIDEYEESEKLFIKFVLGEYVDHGVEELDVGKLPELLIKYGDMNEAVSVFTPIKSRRFSLVFKDYCINLGHLKLF